MYINLLAGTTDFPNTDKQISWQVSILIRIFIVIYLDFLAS